MLSSKLGEFGKVADTDRNVGNLVTHSSTAIACHWRHDVCILIHGMSFSAVTWRNIDMLDLVRLSETPSDSMLTATRTDKQDSELFYKARYCVSMKACHGVVVVVVESSSLLTRSH